MAAFGAGLGIPEDRQGLLVRALTHPSLRDAVDGADYERLEFLGDSVLGFVICDHFYRTEPPLPEGEMTLRKIEHVQEATLAAAARQLGLEDLIATSPSETVEGCTSQPRVLCCAFEAVVGALYLACGLDRAREFILGTVLPNAVAQSGHPKTRLQELTQARWRSLPDYRVTSLPGAEHAPVFQAEVYLDGRLAGTGQGSSKRAAESAAAEEALSRADRGTPPREG